MIVRDELRDIITKLNKYNGRKSNIIILSAHIVVEGIWQLRIDVTNATQTSKGAINELAYIALIFKVDEYETNEKGVEEADTFNILKANANGNHQWDITLELYPSKIDLNGLSKVEKAHLLKELKGTVKAREITPITEDVGKNVAKDFGKLYDMIDADAKETEDGSKDV